MKLLLPLLLFPIIAFSQKTYVPDDNLELMLSSNPGVSDGIPFNDSVLTEGLNSITFLAVSGNEILDFTGLEQLTSLESYSVYGYTGDVVDLSLIPVNSESRMSGSVMTSSVTQLTLPNCPHTSITLQNINISEFILTPEQDLWTGATSGGGAIRILNCSELEYVDISAIDLNIANTHPMIFAVELNPNLSCINMANGFCDYWYTVQFSNNGSLNTVVVDDVNAAENAGMWTWDDRDLWYVYYPNLPNPHNFSSSGCVVSLEEQPDIEKTLIKCTDLLGRQVEPTPNTPLLFHYSNGEVEQRMIVD